MVRKKKAVTPKASKKQKSKVTKVMREFKAGELNIGKSKKKVKSRKQAIAIAMRSAGLARKRSSKKKK